MRVLPAPKIPQGLLLRGDSVKRHISNEALCPFYHSEDGYRICCEGVEDGSSVHVVFPTPQKKQSYSGGFCCKDYKSCRVARMLYAKY